MNKVDKIKEDAFEAKLIIALGLNFIKSLTGGLIYYTTYEISNKIKSL